MWIFGFLDFGTINRESLIGDILKIARKIKMEIIKWDNGK